MSGAASCSACGTTLAETDRFCEACGARIESSSDPRQPTGVQAPDGEPAAGARDGKGRLPLGRLIAAGGVTLGLVSAGLAGLVSGDGADVDETIGPGGGTLRAKGLVLEVPARAFASDTRIRVEPLPTGPTALARSPLYRLTAARRPAKPFKLRFKLSQDVSGARARRLAVVTGEHGRGAFTRVRGRVDEKRREYVVTARHLSYWQLQEAGRLVALGDSFSSGEGVPPFDSQTDTKTNRCHRSPRAWPIKLASRLALSVQSEACSGAVTEDLLTDDPSRKEPERRVSQLARLRELRDVSVVTLTVGGNDIGFAEILAKCATAPRCDRHYTAGGSDRIDVRIETLRRALPGAYQSVQEAAPGDRLVVMGYPRLFPKRPPLLTCSALSTIGQKEERYLNGKTATLNAAIRGAANEAGARFIDVEDAFDGHEVSCSNIKDQYLNHLKLARRDVVSSDSFHPNEAGHARLAEVAARGLEGDVKVETAPDIDSFSLGRTGLGPIKIGMTIGEARSASGLRLQAQKRPESYSPCTIWRAPGQGKGVMLTAIDESLEHIFLSKPTSIETTEHIGVGSSEGALLAAYGGTVLDVTPSGFGGTAKIYRVAAGRADGELALQFQVDHGRVTFMEAGPESSFYYPDGNELCS